MYVQTLKHGPTAGYGEAKKGGCTTCGAEKREDVLIFGLVGNV